MRSLRPPVDDHRVHGLRLDLSGLRRWFQPRVCEPLALLLRDGRGTADDRRRHPWVGSTLGGGLALAMIDADVHIPNPRLEELLPLLPEHWVEHFSNTLDKGASQLYYPPRSPVTGRPGGLEELRESVFDRGGAETAISSCLYAVDSIHNPDVACALASAVNDWQAQGVAGARAAVAGFDRGADRAGRGRGRRGRAQRRPPWLRAGADSGPHRAPAWQPPLPPAVEDNRRERSGGGGPFRRRADHTADAHRLADLLPRGVHGDGTGVRDPAHQPDRRGRVRRLFPACGWCSSSPGSPGCRRTSGAWTRSGGT